MVVKPLVIAMTLLVAQLAHGEVIVAPQIVQKSNRQSVAVPPQRFLVLELGHMDVGEGIAVQVDVSNAMYKDLSVYVVDATNMSLIRQNQPFRYVQGEVKKLAPFVVQTKIAQFGPHYLVFDNRFAAVVEKKVAYQVATLKTLRPQQVEAIRAPLVKMYAGLKQVFNFKDFNIYVRSCGQANAFSTIATGDVTLCTELYEQMLDKPGAFAGVTLHELGHTLLNLWGSPHYGDEDVADQFATIMLLKSGEDGKRALSEWIQWFAGHDSRAQARVMLVHGDTHSLSVQRIRNIQENTRNSSDLMRRWNNVLYPQMTDGALRAIVANPAAFDDAETARRELARRAVGQN